MIASSRGLPCFSTARMRPLNRVRSRDRGGAGTAATLRMPAVGSLSRGPSEIAQMKKRRRQANWRMVSAGAALATVRRFAKRRCTSLRVTPVAVSSSPADCSNHRPTTARSER